MSDGKRDSILILGKAGYGKSTLAKEVVKKMPDPVFVIDTMDEFNEGAVYDDIKEFIKVMMGRCRGFHVMKVKSKSDELYFFKACLAYKKECTILVDEVDKFCSPMSINPEMSQLVHYGRHWNVSLVCCARRAASVHKDVTSQANVIITFRQTEKRDLEALKNYTDEIKKIKTLDKYFFISFGDYVPKQIKYLIKFENISKLESVG